MSASRRPPASSRGTGPRSTRRPARPPGPDTRAAACSFNNNYAGIAIGADGSLYLGVIGGIVRLKDGA